MSLWRGVDDAKHTYVRHPIRNQYNVQQLHHVVVRDRFVKMMILSSSTKVNIHVVQSHDQQYFTLRLLKCKFCDVICGT